MKEISFILSAHLLFLMAIPCCAIDNCSGDITGTKQSANHEPGDENDCGNCSPFFTCTGCAGFTLSVENTDIETIPAFSANQFAWYILSSIPDVHYDFWQPPRLS